MNTVDRIKAIRIEVIYDPKDVAQMFRSSMTWFLSALVTSGAGIVIIYQK